MSKNIKNFNASFINGLSSTIDPLNTITLNNTIKIPHTPLLTNNKVDNTLASLMLKDVNSNINGTFYPISVNSISGTSQLYFNSNTVITDSNLLNEFENISAQYPIDFSNIIVNGGYINFTNGTNTNFNVGPSGVGLRYSSNNKMQFKDFGTDWIDLVDIALHDQFAELVDVDVYTNPLQNNQYITYDASRALFVNSNLAIINDTNPILGGNLNVGNYDLFTNNKIFNIVDNNNINLISLQSNTTSLNSGNYIEIINADNSFYPSITCNGAIDTDINLALNTKGAGDLILNALLGNVVVNADTINVSGYMVNSIYRTSNKVGGYLPQIPWNVPISSDTVLFNFNNSNSSGTYWANVSIGIDGKKLNLIFNNSGIQNIDLLVDFGTNNLICGTGYATCLHFEATGQSSMLIYLGDDIQKWQILNTGTSII